MSDLTDLRDMFLSREAQLAVRRELLQDRRVALADLQEQRDLLQQAVDFVVKLSNDAQLSVLAFMESLLTHGVQDIFDPAWSISLELVKRGGRQAIAIYLHQEAAVVEVPDGVGGGVQQVIGVLMRLAVLHLLRGQLRPVLLLDEPFAHLSSVYIAPMVSVLKSLIVRYNLAVLIVTHQQQLIDMADVVYEFSNVDGVTLIERRI